MSNITFKIEFADGHIEQRTLAPGTYQIGRDVGDIVLADPNTSARHAELRVEPGQVTIVDIGSTNGTYDPSGMRLTGPFVMQRGSPVRMGHTKITALPDGPVAGATRVMSAGELPQFGGPGGQPPPPAQFTPPNAAPPPAFGGPPPPAFGGPPPGQPPGAFGAPGNVPPPPAFGGPPPGGGYAPPGGPPPGAYSPPGQPPGGFGPPGQPPGGYAPPGQPPGGFGAPGQPPGGYAPPPGQPPGGFSPPGQSGAYTPPGQVPPPPGAFSPQAGAFSPLAPNPYSPPTQEAEGAGDKTVAILAYLTLIGFVIALVMHGNSKTQLGAFHLRQALGYLLTAILGGIVMGISVAILAMINLGIIGSLAYSVYGLGMLVLWVLGLLAAIGGQMKPMPVVGAMYQKMFSGAFR